MDKLEIFIGCCLQDRGIAIGLELNLNYIANCTSWFRPNQIGLNEYILDQLVKKANTTDFAIFILGEDDIAQIKGEEKFITRDNVLIELGLFIGKIGRERVFFIIPEDSNLHIPTDLDGIVFSKYSKSENKVDSTKHCSNLIEITIEKIVKQEEKSLSENIKAERFYNSTRELLQKTGMKLRKLGLSFDDIQDFVKDYTSHVSHIQFKRNIPPLHPVEKTEYKEGTKMKCGVCLDEVAITGKRRCPYCKLDLFAWIGTDPS